MRETNRPFVETRRPSNAIAPSMVCPDMCTITTLWRANEEDISLRSSAPGCGCPFTSTSLSDRKTRSISAASECTCPETVHIVSFEEHGLKGPHGPELSNLGRENVREMSPTFGKIHYHQHSGKYIISARLHSHSPPKMLPPPLIALHHPPGLALHRATGVDCFPCKAPSDRVTPGGEVCTCIAVPPRAANTAMPRFFGAALGGVGGGLTPPSGPLRKSARVAKAACGSVRSSSAQATFTGTVRLPGVALGFAHTCSRERDPIIVDEMKESHDC